MRSDPTGVEYPEVQPKPILRAGESCPSMDPEPLEIQPADLVQQRPTWLCRAFDGDGVSVQSSVLPKSAIDLLFCRARSTCLQNACGRLSRHIPAVCRRNPGRARRPRSSRRCPPQTGRSGTASDQGPNTVFIEAAANQNLGVAETATIKNVPDLAGMVSQVSAIEPHPWIAMP